MEKKTKSLLENENKIEVREIELKCFNSSTTRRNKGELGEILDNKGIL